jgi:uncharacterized membrane protein
MRNWSWWGRTFLPLPFSLHAFVGISFVGKIINARNATQTLSISIRLVFVGFLIFPHVQTSIITVATKLDYRRFIEA